jgi:hypothetical protein
VGRAGRRLHPRRAGCCAARRARAPCHVREHLAPTKRHATGVS